MDIPHLVDPVSSTDCSVASIETVVAAFEALNTAVQPRLLAVFDAGVSPSALRYSPSPFLTRLVECDQLCSCYPLQWLPPGGSHGRKRGFEIVVPPAGKPQNEYVACATGAG
jgi:hypothetical protein